MYGYYGSPARAGIDRHHAVGVAGCGGFPRTRWDRPTCRTATRKASAVPPHARGLKITGTVDWIDDGGISMEELRPGLGWSSSFGAMRIADSSKGRELILSATIGKSLTVTCLMTPKSVYMGVRYNLEQCQTP